MDDDEGIWRDVDSETDECNVDGHGEDVYYTCISAGWFGGALILSASTMISLGLLLVAMLSTCLCGTCSATMVDLALRNMADVGDLGWLHGNQVSGGDQFIVGAQAFTLWDNPADPTCAVPLAPYASTYKPYLKLVTAGHKQNQHGELTSEWVDRVATSIAKVAANEGFLFVSTMYIPSFVLYMKRD